MHKICHTVVTGDSRQLSKIAAGAAHLIITSPPYWQLKDYGSRDQIGFNDSYEEYINNLNLVWRECERVLADGCRMCVNIGDQFARSVYYGRYKVIPIRTEIIRFCETLGMDYMGAIIWQKAITMNTTGGGAVMGSFPYPRNGILKIDYEFILIFKKLGDAPKPAAAPKEASALTREEWNQFFASHWNFAGVRQDRHLAMFPEELPRRLIKMFSFAGETVFDPFLGSGTTTLAAKNLGRNSLGYEINADFLPIIKDKIGADNLLDADENRFEFLRDDAPLDAAAKLAELPYLFRDPHRLDKKIDVKKLSFGSKIAGDETARQNFYTVKKVINSYLLELNNNLIVRLIGIKEKSAANGDAVKFLREKLCGQQVFMKYDAVKYDDGHHLFCYLYLKNKTFINAHLLKRGLAAVDDTLDFRHKTKFQGIVDYG
ncbi:MAG: site-specific DNA-methyltransferase [Planctomycetota bacterium]|jgi:site-specific DNA-methyltransferase (adenine-specific)|nr:site-specific DNA-methyltransferase [Planctomycetota bacterium]